MPQFRPYPTVLTMPKRKSRKALRRQIFWENRLQAALERRERRKQNNANRT